MTAKRKRWIVALCLTLLLSLLGVAYVVTFQRDVLQHVAQYLIAGSLGEQITIRDIRVGIFPRPELQLTDVSIGVPGRDTPIFRASNIRMGTDFFSAGEDALKPNILIVENAHLALERDEDGRWNYQDILQDGSSNQLGAFLVGSSLELVNGSIDIEDRFHRDSPLRLHAEAVELQVERLALEGPTEVFLSARLADQGNGSLLSSYGTIEHIGGFLDFEPTEESDLPPQLALYTRMELDRHMLLQMTELFRVAKVPTGLQGQISAQGHIRFAPGMQGYDLVVSNLVVLTDVVDLNVEASLSGLFLPDPPTLSSQWTSTPLAIQHVPQWLPEDWLSSPLYQKIRRQGLRGKVQATAVTFSGSSRQGLGYSLGGEFHLSDGTVTFGDEWGKAEKVGGIIHVQSDRIQLSGFHGIYNDIPVTDGTGTIALKEGGPWLTTTLVGTVSPAQLLGVVRKFLDGDVGQYLMPSFHDQAGHGSVTIGFSGPLRHPENIVFQSAEYRPEQVTVRLPGLQGIVTHVSGLLAFSPQHLRIENVRGRYGKSDFQIKGQMNFAKQSSINEVIIQGRMYGHDLLTLFPQPNSAEREMLAGAARYMVVVAGKPDAPTIRGAVDLQGLGIVVPGIVNKSPTLEGQLNFNIQIGKHRRILFRHISLGVPSVGLAGQGYIRYGQTPAIHVSFTTDPIHFSALPPGLQLFDGMMSDGKLEVSLALRGTGRDWRLWNKSGWVALTKGTVNIQGLTPPISHVFLRARLNGHVADLKHLQWRMEESRARVTGTIQQWDSHPSMTGTLTSSQFDLAHLVPKGQKTFLRSILETIARTATVSGDLQFDRARYKELSFQTLAGRLRIQDGIVGIEDIQGRTEHGTIQGRVLAHLPPQQPATVKTWFEVDKIPMLALEQTFLEATTLDEQFITGMVSAQGVLAGDGKDARGILPTLNGHLTFSVVDGRIAKSTVVPKILTILNLPSILQGQVDLRKAGYPFDEHTGTLTVANGLITSEDIVIDGPIMTMTAAGQYDFLHDNLDVVTAISPFGPYFNLLRNIPLFGLFVDNGEGEVLSALFQIKGSLHAPDVTPMPLESFAMGLTRFGMLAFNVLKNTITLPSKIFFNDENTLPPSSLPADSLDEEGEF